MRSGKNSSSAKSNSSSNHPTAPISTAASLKGSDSAGTALLTRLGFSRVGEWSLAANKPQVALRLLADAKQVIYAFVRENEVLYVGKTVRSLRSRMRSYEQPGPAQRTNKRVNGCLAASLIDGKPVHVHAMSKWDGTPYRGIPLNVAAGLEDPLIELLQPKWNVASAGKD